MMIERQIATLVAGTQSGWYLWNAALRALELSIDRSRREGVDAFASWPRGELNRLLLDIDEALNMATLAVDLRELITGIEDRPDSRVRHDVAELLLKRARDVMSAKGLPTSNREYGVGASAPL